MRCFRRGVSANIAIPAPRPNSPTPPKRLKENLAGVDGWRLPSFTHSQANTGARMKMNSAFKDWNQLLGKGWPRTSLRVLRSANRFRVDPACSNTDQNTAAATKYAMIAYRR